MRHRRYIESGAMYELCFRAREGLPFPPLRVIDLIIKSALARAQREGLLQLCHDIWLSNHAHLIVRALDAKGLVKFYAETQKRITDYLKKFLNLEYLDLWEERIMVARIYDLAKAKERIRYLYLNPARANLVDSINEYPGVSSWLAFTTVSPSVKAQYKEKVPWIRLPSVEPLPSRTLTKTQDLHITTKLKESAEIEHDLTLEPNVWMLAFGITSEEEIKEINQDIFQMIGEGETALKLERAKEGKRSFGAERLQREAILKPHTPKKKERCIFVLSSINELRVSFIKSYQSLCQYCAELYEEFVRGIPVHWPPGILAPACVPLANALAD